MALLWDSYGIPMGCLREFYGILMGFLCGSYAIPCYIIGVPIHYVKLCRSFRAV